MYNIVTIQEAFAGRHGWRKHPNPAETRNPMGDMLPSASGRYFQDEHALLTNENLINTFDIFGDFTYAAWSNATTYSKGDMIYTGSAYYVSIVDSNLNHVVTDVLYWRLTTPFNEQLRQITMAGAAKVINDWFNLKTTLRSSKSLLKKSLVLAIPGYKGTTFTSANYVGWRVVPTPSQDVILTIDRLCLHVEESTTVTVGLYKDGSTTPEQTTIFTTDGTPTWKQVNWELERGSYYYVAYDRTSLEPINGIANAYRDWTYNRFPGTLPYAEVSAFEYANTSWGDITDSQRCDNNYGLNMMISAKCDYTDLVVDHIDLFDDSFAKATTIGALRWMAMNPNARINRNEANIDPIRILYEIEGDAIGRNGGLKKDYDVALKGITFDDRKFSEHCLPCKRSGIRAKSA